jgi:hypothetical protein
MLCIVPMKRPSQQSRWSHRDAQKSPASSTPFDNSADETSAGIARQRYAGQGFLITAEPPVTTVALEALPVVAVPGDSEVGEAR